VLDTGRMIAEMAPEIGVGEQLRGRWVAIERFRLQDPPPALDVDERAQAAAFFATEDLEPERAFEVIEAEKASCKSTPSDARMPALFGMLTTPAAASAGLRGSWPTCVRPAEVVSRKTVAKLVRDNGIRGISPRRW
jgi:hypothetical protein